MERKGKEWKGIEKGQIPLFGWEAQTRKAFPMERLIHPSDGIDIPTKLGWNTNSIPLCFYFCPNYPCPSSCLLFSMNVCGEEQLLQLPYQTRKRSLEPHQWWFRARTQRLQVCFLTPTFVLALPWVLHSDFEFE